MPKARKNTRRTPASPPALPVPAIAVDRLLCDLRALIEATREQTARAVNSALVGLYWNIGTRIRQDVLQEKRAGYGEQIVDSLSTHLSAEYGRGFGRRSLFRMIQFAEFFPDEPIVSALSAQLGWSHFVELIALDDSLKRDFYAEMCRAERWNVRTLRQKIGHLLYERTANSKNPDEVIVRDITALRDEDRMTPDLVFRDPYFLDFLGLTAVRTPRRTSRRRSFVSWRHSSWSWAPTSPSSRGRNASRSTVWIITWTCSSTTADCAVW